MFSKYFKPKSVLYRLMKLRLLTKMLLMEIILEVKVTTNISTTKKPSIFLFQIFDPCFNPQTTKYLYPRFRAFFGLFSLKATYCCFQKVRAKLFHSKLNFKQKQPVFVASQCASLLLRSKAVQRNYEQFLNFTLNFKQKEPGFLAFQCTSLLLRHKIEQQNYRHCFERFQTQRRTLQVNESQIISENAFNGHHFRSAYGHEYINIEKTFF